MSDDLVKQLQNPRPMSMFLTRADQAKDWTELLHTAADRIKELEAKLAKLTKTADRVHDSYWYSSDGIIVGMHDLGEALHDARTTLAELTGGKDE